MASHTLDTQHFLSQYSSTLAVHDVTQIVTCLSVSNLESSVPLFTLDTEHFHIQYDSTVAVHK